MQKIAGAWRGRLSKGASGIEYALLLMGVSALGIWAALDVGSSTQQSLDGAQVQLAEGVEEALDGQHGPVGPVASAPGEDGAPQEEGFGAPLVMTFAGTTARFGGAPAWGDNFVVDPETSIVSSASGTPARVDWGPGAQGCPEFVTVYMGALECTYADAGPHTVRVDPVYSSLSDLGAELTGIESWGDTPLVWLQSTFRYTPNLARLPADLPPTVTSLASIFRGATAIPSDISSWNVANVTNMGLAFGYAVADIPDITGWRPGNTTSMQQMFVNTNFDQAIGAWPVHSLRHGAALFEGTPFNQDISNWKTVSLTEAGAMFKNNSAFNQDITGWDMSKVYHAPNMFDGASSFNQDIGPAWKPASLRLYSQMFRGTTSLRTDFTSWRPVPGDWSNTARVFDNSAAVGDLRCWDMEHIPETPANFNRNAPGIIAPLWGQPPAQSCAPVAP